MAAGFGERQRAEEFARLLDSLDDGPHAGVSTLDRDGGDGDGGQYQDGIQDGIQIDGPSGGAEPFGGAGTLINGAHRDPSRDVDGWEDFADAASRDGRAAHPVEPVLPAQRTASPDGVSRSIREGLDPELAAMLRAVEAVIGEGRLHPPRIRPAFKEELGRRLQEDFLRLFNADVDDHRGGGTLVSRPRGGSPWRRRLLGGSVAVGVLSGGIGGVALAASTALPGDPLYGVKRGLENMRVSVSGSDLERGEQYLGQAKTRLGEIRHLLAHHDANVDGSAASGHIGDTMDNLYQDMNSAGQLLAPLAEHGDTDALTNLRDFLNTYEPQVHDLEVLLAPESQDKARRLLALMHSLDAQVAAAQAAIDHAKTHPGSAPSASRHPSAPAASPSGAVTTAGADRHGGTPQSEGGAGPSTGAPAPDSAPLDVQVPIGSPATTVVVPPLLSGLPPIGITLGNTGPATGPTTNAGPPPTDPNPN